MKIQQLDEVEGRRTFVMVCDRGDDPVEALTAAAKRFDRAHIHVVVARYDGSALGGHLLGGTVDPTIEVMIVESPQPLRRKTDPATGLVLLDIDWSGS